MANTLNIFDHISSDCESDTVSELSNTTIDAAEILKGMICFI